MISIQKPFITEKTLSAAGKGVYTFAVDPKSNKHVIARDVERLYSVKVIGIKTITMHGKTRRVGKRSKTIKRSDWKKAIVTLVKGQKIDAFEVSSGEAK